MRSDWRQFSTADLIEAGVLSIGDGYRAKNSEMATEGMPFARAGDIDGGVHLDCADLLAPESVARAGDKLSRSGDSVFTSKGTVGRFAYVTPETRPFVYSPQLCFWRAGNRNVLSPRFLYYWLQGREASVQFRSLKGQTDMADYVSLRDQRQMNITLPPLEEQRRIAGVLGALDDKLEHNQTLVARLMEVCNLRYAGLAVAPVKVGDVGEVVKGLSYKGDGLVADGIPMFNLANFNVRSWADMDGLKYYAGEFRERHVVSGGDLLVANTDLTQRREILGRPLLVPIDVDFALFTHHLYAVRFKERFDPYRLPLYFGLRTAEFRGRAESFATGTTVAALPRDGLLDFEFRAPHAESLGEFNREAELLLARAWGAERESSRVEELRDALLPKLVSGAIRIRDSYDPDGALGSVVEAAGVAMP